MKKITSLLLLCLMLLGTGSVKAEFAADVVRASDLKVGDQITLMMTPAAGNYRHTRYMCAGDNSSKMFTQENPDDLGNIWTLVAAEQTGEFYLCHLATGKFAGVAQTNNNAWMPLEVENVAKMGIYSFLDKGDKMNVVIKNPGTGLNNADKLCLTYQQDSHKIVRWGADGAHGQWTVKRVKRADHYLSNIPEGMGYARGDRHLDQVKLTSGDGDQVFAIPAPLKVYTKAMNKVFHAKAGESVKAAVGYTGTWMNTYIYVDFDKDGAFDEQKDLKSSTTGNNLNANPFMVPVSTPVGRYAMRYKVDWDCQDPAGAVKTQNGLMKNGGALCDVILNVHGADCKVTVKSTADCQVTAENGEALNTVAFGQNLKVKVVAKSDMVVTALTVRHGYGLEGQPVVNGVPQYSEDRVPVTASGAEWTATLPAAYLEGEVQIVPVVHGLNEKVNVAVAENADCAVTAENGEALTATTIGKSLNVKVVAKNNKYVNALLVRHGNQLEGEPQVNGVVQYQEERINIVSAATEHVVTIPAAYVDAAIRIIPVVSEQALIFADEFNGANGTQPNSVWKRSPRWGSTWNRLCSKAEDVVYMQDGNLVCRAIKNEPAIAGETIPNGDVNMRTGAIETSGNDGFNFRYGKVECRAKANPFEGTFPAIWMMPHDGTGGWPSCGEIDIFELVNNENKAHHTIHTNWSYNLGYRWTSNEVVDYSQYHVYGLEWDDTSLNFYVDGKKMGTYSKSTDLNALRQYQWPFDRNFYLILNQSVGRKGDWARQPDVNHIYEFFVDWIRVYQNPHHAKVCELRAAINKVKEYGEGDEVNQYTINHDVLDAAKAVLNDEQNKSVEELQKAIDAMKRAAVLNMPKVNNFYRLRCADEKSQMKFIQSTQTNGKQNMVSYADGKGVEATFFYDGKGFISYTKGLYCGSGALKQAGEAVATEIGLPSNGRMGQYTVKVDGKFLNGKEATLGVSEWTNDYTNCSGNWWFEPVDALQVVFGADTHHEGAYATLFTPVTLQMPADVTAYKGTLENGSVKLTAIEGQIIPAGQAVVLKTAEEGVKTLMVTTAESMANMEGNQLKGSVATTLCGDNEYFAMGKKQDLIAFYTVAGGQYRGFCAVLEKSGAMSNELKMVFDEATGVENVEMEVPADAVVYDLSGRRVKVAAKGLYLVNGKKMYLK